MKLKQKHIALETPLRELCNLGQLSEILVNLLAKKGIFTVEQVCLCTADDLKAAPRIDRDHRSMIDLCLKDYGLEFGMTRTELDLYKKSPIVIVGNEVWEQRRFELATRIYLARIGNKNGVKRIAEEAVKTADLLLEALKNPPSA